MSIILAKRDFIISGSNILSGDQLSVKNSIISVSRKTDEGVIDFPIITQIGTHILSDEQITRVIEKSNEQ